MRYVLTENIVIPAGTEFKVTDKDYGPAGALEYIQERGIMRVFLGRAAALDQGMVVARPIIKAVE
jgi:hypothetical protein